MVGIPHTKFNTGWIEGSRNLKKEGAHDFQFFASCKGNVDLNSITFECSASKFLFAHFMCQEDKKTVWPWTREEHMHDRCYWVYLQISSRKLCLFGVTLLFAWNVLRFRVKITSLRTTVLSCRTKLSLHFIPIGLFIYKKASVSVVNAW